MTTLLTDPFQFDDLLTPAQRGHFRPTVAGQADVRGQGTAGGGAFV